MGNVPDAAGNVSDETHGLMTECTRGLNSDRDEVVCPGYGDVLYLVLVKHAGVFAHTYVNVIIL